MAGYLMEPVISNTVNALKIQKALRAHTIPCTVSVIDNTDPTTIPCPCLNNMHNVYSPTWHKEHPDEPDCEGTGYLKDGIEPAPTEIVETQMIVLPRYLMGGWENQYKFFSEVPNWDWAAIDYQNYVFNRLEFTDGLKIYRKFVVTAILPYYLDNVNIPAAMIYLLEPVNKLDIL